MPVEECGDRERDQGFFGGPDSHRGLVAWGDRKLVKNSTDEMAGTIERHRNVATRLAPSHDRHQEMTVLLSTRVAGMRGSGSSP